MRRNDMKHDDSDFEHLLKQRIFVPPRKDLAQHILREARAISRQEKPTLSDFIQNLFIEFKLPSPAFALSFVLLLGFVVGLSIQNWQQNNIQSDTYNIVTLENFLHAGENIL